VDGEYMEYLIGALIVVAFFIAVTSGVYLGYRLNLRKSKLPDADENKKREIEQFNKDFKAMFSYDVNTALQRKKV
jgi:adenine-specific DNA methylase